MLLQRLFVATRPFTDHDEAVWKDVEMAEDRDRHVAARDQIEAGLPSGLLGSLAEEIPKLTGVGGREMVPERAADHLRSTAKARLQKAMVPS